MSGFSILQLVAAQAGATIAAGVLGFVAIVAVRETLRILAGSLWARGLSVATQTVLVVMTVVALIGLPTVSRHVARDWVESDTHRIVPPPALFAALCDWIGGSELERMPPTMPPRIRRPSPAFCNSSGGWRYGIRRLALGWLHWDRTAFARSGR